MAEALDENSINTDLTFESGDENVCILRILSITIEFLRIETNLAKWLLSNNNCIHAFCSFCVHSGIGRIIVSSRMHTIK